MIPTFLGEGNGYFQVPVWLTGRKLGTSAMGSLMETDYHPGGPAKWKPGRIPEMISFLLKDFSTDIVVCMHLKKTFPVESCVWRSHSLV